MGVRHQRQPVAACFAADLHLDAGPIVARRDGRLILVETSFEAEQKTIVAMTRPNQAGMPPMVGAFSANRSICCGTRRRADLCLLWRSMGLSLILIARER